MIKVIFSDEDKLPSPQQGEKTDFPNKAPDVIPHTYMENWQQQEELKPKPENTSDVRQKAPDVIPRSDDWQQQYNSNVSLQAEKAHDGQSALKYTPMEYRMPPETEVLTNASGYVAPYGCYQALAPYGYRQYPAQYPAQQNFPTSLEIANAVTIPVDPIMGANNY